MFVLFRGMFSMSTSSGGFRFKLKRVKDTRYGLLPLLRIKLYLYDKSNLVIVMSRLGVSRLFWGNSEGGSSGGTRIIV